MKFPMMQTLNSNRDGMPHQENLAEAFKSPLTPEEQLSGLRVNYYLVDVNHPQRENQLPYRAECEDLIEALELTPNEANIFKEIWRGANARKGNGKPSHRAVYGAEKILHYAGRHLKSIQRKS